MPSGLNIDRKGFTNVSGAEEVRQMKWVLKGREIALDRRFAQRASARKRGDARFRSVPIPALVVS